MTRLEALVALNMVDGIGSVRLGRLLEYFQTPQDILKAPAEKLIAVTGIAAETASRVKSLKSEDLNQEFTLAQRQGLAIISFEDNSYPENLKQIPGFPIVLYIKGELKKEDEISIAIVGSRRASFYGLSCAEKFAASLSDAGFTIVSGMARGVDTYAHRGALKKRGRTVAVMGSGFNNIYPQENKRLIEEISGNGAVISEFPMDAQPLKQNFPRRNRIISGLSLGTLVVEAARNSGALITADFALEQGREVFALPGSINSGNSFGTNELIKQGAKLVSCVEDIMEEFSSALATSGSVKDKTDKQAAEHFRKEEDLYGIISKEPIFFDDIMERTNLGISTVSNMLLKLQLKKLVKQLPGKQFVRN